MKITSVVPLFSGNNLFVRIATDEGILGYGEGTLNTRIKAVAAVLTDLEPVLVGQDPFRIERIWQEIYRNTFWRGGPVLLSALSAVDMALWDIKGKALNTPVYDLLGGPSRNRIRIYTHVGGPTPDALCRSAEAALAEGYSALRICPHDNIPEGWYDMGTQVRRSVAFMKALRECVGDEVEIIFECHTRLTPSWAIKLCEAIAPYRPLFVEDAIRADSTESYRLVRAHTDVTLGTGEKFGSPFDYKTALEEDLIDFARTDICNCGGITAFMKIANLAEAHYVDMLPHGIPGPVGMMASLHCDLAASNFVMQERGVLSTDYAETDVRMENGCAILGNAPGLGVRIDESRFTPATHYEHPHWVRPDGAVQDW